MRIDVEAVRRALGREAERLAAQPAPLDDASRHAAVAAVLRDAAAGAEVLLIRRAALEGDPWSGHMAFPGGRRHQADRDLLATAIRETREEVGLDLERAEAVGRLEPLPVYARGRPTGMLVAPFVFAVSGEPELVLDRREVDEALWTPLGALASGELGTEIDWRRGDEHVRLPAWDVQGRIVWGLTYRMLSELFELLRR
jgi:8-oxo-dGTP pyrophosphatase MutT (NUDIX family)